MTTSSRWYVSNLRLQLRIKMQRIAIEKKFLDKKRFEIIHTTGYYIDESTFYNDYDTCDYLEQLYCQANKIVANILDNSPISG